MADNPQDWERIAQERNKQKAAEKLRQFNSGDTTRGFTNNAGHTMPNLMNQQNMNRAPNGAMPNNQNRPTSNGQIPNNMGGRPRPGTMNGTRPNGNVPNGMGGRPMPGNMNNGSPMPNVANSHQGPNGNMQQRPMPNTQQPANVQQNNQEYYNTKVKKAKKNKIGNVVVDQDAIEVLTSSAGQGRYRRKRLVIIILLILIALIWGFVLISGMVKQKPAEFNCSMSVSGDAKDTATLKLNGDLADKWHTPTTGTEIGPGATYRDIRITIDLSATNSYDIKFRVEILKGSTLIEDFGFINAPIIYTKTVGTDNHNWYVAENVAGRQTVDILSSITFYEVSENGKLYGLNSGNIEINIYVVVDVA